MFNMLLHFRASRVLVVALVVLVLGCGNVQGVQGEAAPSAKCAICQKVASVLTPLVKNNVSEAVIRVVATEVCNVYENRGHPDCDSVPHCRDLCHGIIRTEMYDVLQIFLDIVNPAEVCYRVSLCPAPAPPVPPTIRSNLTDHAGEVAWPAWNLTTGTGTFVHFSDIHVDMKYMVGANDACGEPLCCRLNSGAANASTAAGFWGDNKGNCDIPIVTLVSALMKASSMEPPPDFVLFTGDAPPHSVWDQSVEENLLATRTIAALFKQFFPNIPVFNTLGNHESYPVNQYQGPGGDSWLYDAAATAWSHWLPDDALHTLQFGGFYQARVRPGLRVVSLNTNVYASGDFWLAEHKNLDFSGQLAWFEDVLVQARALGEKVITIGHHFLGSLTDPFSNSLSALFSRYRDVLVDHFRGHTHSTVMQLSFDQIMNQSAPIQMQYQAGSLTTYSLLNPTFRVYSYNRALPRPFLVEDYDQYWLDLNVANSGNTSDWGSPRYSAKAAFNLSELTPTAWFDWAESLFQDPQAYAAFWTYSVRNVTQTPDSVAGTVCDMLGPNTVLLNACFTQHGVPDGSIPRPPGRCDADVPRPLQGRQA